MNTARWRDGLWRVDCGSFTAGFVISNGRLIRIAPCLRHAFDIFARHAIWICASLALICPLLAASVTLARDPSPEAVSYRLYVGIQSLRAGNAPLIWYPTDATQYRVEGLDYLTEYFFVATALSAEGLESGYSNEVQYTPTPPAEPTPTPIPAVTPGPPWKHGHEQ